jgi:hypothetical protein
MMIANHTSSTNEWAASLSGLERFVVLTDHTTRKLELRRVLLCFKLSLSCHGLCCICSTHHDTLTYDLLTRAHAHTQLSDS